MKYTDLHVHTHFCGHATGTIEETIQSAIQKEINILGFSEHYPYPADYREPIPDCVVPPDQWPVYIDEIRRLKSVYARKVDIRIGAEIDYLPGYEKEIGIRIQKEHLDHIFGSMHIVDDIAIDYRDDYLQEHIETLGGVDTLWEKYRNGMEKLIRTGLCDIIAHLDLPKKLQSAQPVKDQTDGFRHILELMKQYDLVLEINTGGIDRTHHQEPYPSLQILKHAAELGLEITLGSDSHAPGQVGRYFDRACLWLKSFGWDKIVVFKNREKEYVALYD